MSIEAELDLDKLFLPAWAQESPAFNKYSGHSGDDRGGRGDRDRDRRSGPRPPRRDFGAPGGGRPGGGAPRGGGAGGDRGPRRFGDRPPQGRGNFRREDRGERREFVPLPEIDVSLMPDEKGVDSLARQIKMTGRAYPLFEIAKIILQKPDRQQVKFDVVKREGKVLQPLFLCMLDDTLWLSEQEAVTYILEKHFDTFYKAERTPTDPPKGVFTFVGQCGISGVILGPPNYHNYQTNLRKLHAERFSRMPFEMFKSRVKIVRDEAVVKKWIEDQSWKTEFTTLNVPEAEVAKLQSREEVEQHFRKTHVANIVKEVESHSMSGQASRQLRCQPLLRLLRIAWEEQQRFPLKVVNVLSGQFAQRGLQFFKVNKHVTHVAIARPHHLDLEATPVSDSVRKIVEFIDAHQKCTRRALIEALAPTPKPAEGAAKAEPTETTPEQNAIIGDLHWLVHQGHVIEFANGTLETAKKPKPRPEPAKKTEPRNETVPNASVETIEPKVAELEASRPSPAVEAATEATSSVPEFSEAEIADLEQTGEENLAAPEPSESPEPKPASTQT